MKYYKLDYKHTDWRDLPIRRYMEADIVRLGTMRPGKTKRDNKRRADNDR